MFSVFVFDYVDYTSAFVVRAFVTALNCPMRYCPARFCYCALLSARFCRRGFVWRAFVWSPSFTFTISQATLKLETNGLQIKINVNIRM